MAAVRGLNNKTRCREPIRSCLLRAIERHLFGQSPPHGKIENTVAAKEMSQSTAAAALSAFMVLHIRGTGGDNTRQPIKKGRGDKFEKKILPSTTFDFPGHYFEINKSRYQDFKGKGETVDAESLHVTPPVPRPPSLRGQVVGISTPTQACPLQNIPSVSSNHFTCRKKTFVFPICTPANPKRSRKLPPCATRGAGAPRLGLGFAFARSSLDTALLLKRGTTSNRISLFRCISEFVFKLGDVYVGRG